MSAALPSHLVGLLEPDAYPHPAGRVEVIETHLAWIFLAGHFAYKVKRPVRLPFVDQRSLDKRAFLCAEELRLNRRFAPDLYMEVVKIVNVGGAPRIGSQGSVLDFAVRMRKFDRSQQLDRLLASGSIAAEELEAFGERVAVQHEKLPRSGEAQPWGWPAAVRRIHSENASQCEAALSSRFGIEYAAGPIAALMAQRLEALGALMTVRIAEGAVRECHGDLHSRNIVRHEGRLTAYDCLEFEPEFRWIDVAEEVAFLTVDLEARGHPHHAHAFLSGWLTHSGDYVACRLINLYEAHHALVRAKVIALSPDDSGDSDQVSLERVEACLAAARSALNRKNPTLIVISGLSGSGKTTLARKLAKELPAVHLRSDIERKRLAGFAPRVSSQSSLGGGLYSAEQSARVYERLQACAFASLTGGFNTIVDATFNLRAERQRFRELADRAGMKLMFLRCHAPVEILRSRIRHRAARGDDASEATLDVLDWQLARAEAVNPQERLEVLQIDTRGPDPSPPFERILKACSTAQ
jgi:aminoglycoside phosphotransferase family enzyme/predicted kinase